MQNQFPRPHDLIEANRKLMLEHLKMCPLCNTVNSRLNGECFVCRWHGEFVHDPVAVEEGLLDVLERCPELIDSILHIPRPRRPLEVVRDWFQRIARRPLDLEA